MMRCEQARELITALLDNELERSERGAIDAHLKVCGDCARAFEQEGVHKRRIQLAARQMSAPAELRRTVEEKAIAEMPAAGWAKRYLAAWSAWRWRNIFSEATLPAWRRGLVATILLVIASTVMYTQWRTEKENSIGLAALNTHVSIISGKTTLLRAVNLPAMRQELAHAVGDRFKPVVLDLSVSKLYPVAGFVQSIEGRDLLVTVYQGDGPAITCFTFIGSEADAPHDAERFFDAESGINYLSFMRGDLTGVLHREGEVICLLVSKMAPAELLAVLRGKSAHA